jgi:hypothetical protein
MDMPERSLSRKAPRGGACCAARPGCPVGYIHALGKRDDTVVIGKAGNIPANALSPQGTLTAPSFLPPKPLKHFYLVFPAQIAKVSLIKSEQSVFAHVDIIQDYADNHVDQRHAP